MKEIIAYQTKKGTIKTKQYEAEYEDLQTDLKEFWQKLRLLGKRDYFNEQLFADLNEAFITGDPKLSEKPLALRSFLRKMIAFRRRYEHYDILYQLWKQAEDARTRSAQPAANVPPDDGIPF